MNFIDELAFNIALKINEFGFTAKLVLQGIKIGLERGMTVYFGFALAKQVKVWTVYDCNFFQYGKVLQSYTLIVKAFSEN